MYLFGLIAGARSMVRKVHRMDEECPEEDKQAGTKMQDAVVGPNTSLDDVYDDRARPQEEFTCSLYISRAVGPQGQVQEIQGGKLSASLFNESSSACISCFASLYDDGNDIQNNRCRIALER